jgi:hypothetical protein
MPASLSNDPKHWRDRAKEKRALADRLRNEQAKQAVLRVANSISDWLSKPKNDQGVRHDPNR